MHIKLNADSIGTVWAEKITLKQWWDRNLVFVCSTDADENGEYFDIYVLKEKYYFAERNTAYD